MDLSSLTGGKASKQEQKPALEYTAQAASLMGKDEAKLTIGEDALTVATLFRTLEIPYSMILGIVYDTELYDVLIKSTEGDTELSRMGNWAQPFYNALCDAFNKAVLRALFVKGDPILTAKGKYSHAEDGAKMAPLLSMFTKTALCPFRLITTRCASPSVSSRVWTRAIMS